jgi:hypothetical protein
LVLAARFLEGFAGSAAAGALSPSTSSAPLNVGLHEIKIDQLSTLNTPLLVFCYFFV